MKSPLHHPLLSLPLLLLNINTIFAFPDRLHRARDSGSSSEINESNCGVIPCTTFNATEQFVDVRPGGSNAYIAPGKGDLRGPCSGLNAAANHGFIPRNGIVSLQQTIDGMAKAFGMGVDFATALGVIAIMFSGDVQSLTWSIGGPYNGGLLSSLGDKPEGLTGSHNRYEGDASATRSDAYLNNGDATSLIMSKFEHLYNLTDTFTLSTIRAQNLYNRNLSLTTNPYFFSGPFTGLLVAPAAHNFIPTFMSNHSTTSPNGTLTKSTLKTFFAITGPDNALLWNPGQEQIPQNWYRRPLSNPYDIKSAIADILVNAIENPETFQVGGNTGSVDSFVGVDLGDLTGGVYDAGNLLEGNNLACFAFQAASAGFFATASGIVGVAEGVLEDVENMIGTYLGPILGDLGCPALEGYDEGLLRKYPGYGYDSTG